MFCKNCGKQLADNAFACPECGCMVAQKNAQATEKPTTAKKTNAGFFISLFSIIALAVWGLTTGYLPYELGFAYDGVHLIISIVSAGCATTAFIFSFFEKENKALKLIGILVFIFCFVQTLTVIYQIRIIRFGYGY